MDNEAAILFRIAVHEAGHLVAMRVLGLHGHAEAKSTGGLTWPIGKQKLEARLEARRQMMVSQAGAIAEQLLLDANTMNATAPSFKKTAEPGTDEHTIINLGMMFGGDDPCDYHEECRYRVVALLTRNRQALDEVAMRIFERGDASSFMGPLFKVKKQMELLEDFEADHGT